MTKLKQVEQAIQTFNSKRNALVNKYQKYIDNIEWHIKTNQPPEEEINKCNSQIGYYKEFINDLKFL